MEEKDKGKFEMRDEANTNVKRKRRKTIMMMYE